MKDNLAKNKFFNGTQINYGLFASKKPRWSLSTMDETETFSTKKLKVVGENNALLLDHSEQQSASKETKDVNEPSSMKVIAPQLSPGFDLLAGMSIDSGNIIQNEHCLKLNVFVPEAVAEQPNQLLPVMVWIHGGGFQIGSGSLPFYDGQKLANKANAIVVSINYRLGALGFLRLCDISDGEIRSTGNEGLEDQITALKWVNRHITQYGGDKDNVTLFGESAGAMSIACLLATTKSKGLFHKAILQSGAGHTYSSIEKANEVAAEFVNSAKALGYTLEDLPTLTTEQILAIQKHFLARPEIYKRFGMLPFCPVIETDLLPNAPHEALKQGFAKDITLLAGTNTDEWTLFAAMTGQKIKNNEQLYGYMAHLIDDSLISETLTLIKSELKSRGIERTAQNMLSEFLGDYWFTQPCHRLLENHASSGGTGYRYKLGRRSIIKGLRSTHITDIGLVFGHADKSFYGDDKRVADLVDEFQTAWATFALSKDPSTGETKWPVYNKSNHYEYLFFNHQNTKIDQEDTSYFDLWNKLSDQQLANF